MYIINADWGPVKHLRSHTIYYFSGDMYVPCFDKVSYQFVCVCNATFVSTATFTRVSVYECLFLITDTITIHSFSSKSPTNPILTK